MALSGGKVATLQCCSEHSFRFVQTWWKIGEGVENCQQTCSAASSIIYTESTRLCSKYKALILCDYVYCPDKIYWIWWCPIKTLSLHNFSPSACTMQGSMPFQRAKIHGSTTRPLELCRWLTNYWVAPSKYNTGNLYTNSGRKIVCLIMYISNCISKWACLLLWDCLCMHVNLTHYGKYMNYILYANPSCFSRLEVEGFDFERTTLN